MSNLQPSQLAFHISAIYRQPSQQQNQQPGGVSVPQASASAASGLGNARPRVQDLTRRVQGMGLKLVGELWGLKMGIGEVNYPGDWVPRNGVLSTQTVPPMDL